MGLMIDFKGLTAKWRKRRDLTMKELGDRANLSSPKSYINNLERGINQKPNAETWLAICKVLEITPDGRDLRRLRDESSTEADLRKTYMVDWGSRSQEGAGRPRPFNPLDDLQLAVGARGLMEDPEGIRWHVQVQQQGGNKVLAIWAVDSNEKV